MANVLPVENVRSVWHFYRARFILAASFVITALSLIAIAALIPSYVLLLSDTSSSQSAPSAGKIDEQADHAELARTQGLITQLSPVAFATSSPLDAIEHALLLRPKGITVARIMFTNGKQDTIVFNGTSQTRESVNAYRKVLQSDPSYASVVIPVEDLVGNGNQLTVTLSGSF